MLDVLRKLVVGVLVVGLPPCGIALAQLSSADEEGVRIFEQAYFDEFNPVTARDLVQRTPGFNAQEQDGGRGLSGVRSNVLINGLRPPPKGKSAQQLLDEMPYTNVERIELIDTGARLDIDMQGFPQVVNVITREDRTSYYEFVTQYNRSGTGDVDQQNQRNAELQATGSFMVGPHSFSMRGEMQDMSNTSPADFVEIDPANPVQRVSSLNTFARNEQEVGLTALFTLPAESTLSFNADFSGGDRGSSPESLDSTVEEIIQSFSNDNDRRDLTLEYRRPMWGAGELLFAMVDARSEDQSESMLEDQDLLRTSVRDRESGETAARLQLTQAPTDRITIRTTGTTAFNYFEGTFSAFENGVEIPIAGSDSRVEEDRHSLDAEVDWNWNNRWSFRSRLGAESYVIDSRDASSGRQVDPKGLVSVTFRPQDRTTFTMESRREIGQLSFSQFLASSDLSSEIVQAGAVELEPERRWVHSATYDRRFFDRGVFRASLAHEEIENPVRTVALSDSMFVSQNTSPQRINRLEASIEYPLERFGRENLIVELGGAITDSSTIDPVTGEKREVSWASGDFWHIGMRRDPGDGRLSWGFNIWNPSGGTNYSVRQIFVEEQDRQWQGFVEYEIIDGLWLNGRVESARTNIVATTFYPSVRAPGLDPSFIALTTHEQDASARIGVEWRRRPNFEISANISTRPANRTTELLTPFGDPTGTYLTRDIAQSPRIWLRFRYFK